MNLSLGSIFNYCPWRMVISFMQGIYDPPLWKKKLAILNAGYFFTYLVIWQFQSLSSSVNSFFVYFLCIWFSPSGLHGNLWNKFIGYVSNCHYSEKLHCILLTLIEKSESYHFEERLFRWLLLDHKSLNWMEDHLALSKHFVREKWHFRAIHIIRHFSDLHFLPPFPLL